MQAIERNAAVPGRLLVAFALGYAAVLPLLLQRFGENGHFFTFNIGTGILLPATVGIALLGGLLFLLLWIEKRLDLLRFWIPRAIVAAILLNLTLRILHGATDLDGAQLLQKLGVETDADRWWRRVRTIFYTSAILVIAWKSRARAFVPALFRFFLVILACFSALAAYRAAPPIYAEVRAKLSHPGSTNTYTGRSVVWVIFDELDFIELEKAMAAGIAPNFAAFERSALKATRARSPASRTLYSVPQLISGAHFDKVEIQGFDLMVNPAGTDTAKPVGEVDHVLESVRATHGPVQVIGFYHPYCRLFPRLDDCRSFSISNIPGLANLAFETMHVLSLSGSDEIMELTGLRPDQYGTEWRDRMDWISHQQISAIERDFEPGRYALHYLHFNLPHSPLSKIAERRFRYTPEDVERVGWYQINLRLADAILGEIMRKIETRARDNEILVIVSSDHGRRPQGWDKNEETDAEVIRHIPFLVRLGRSTSPLVLDAGVDTRSTRLLIERYLAGEVGVLTDIPAAIGATDGRPRIAGGTGGNGTIAGRGNTANRPQ